MPFIFYLPGGALATAGGGSVEENQQRPYMIDLARRKGVEVSVLAVKVQEKAGKYSAVLRFASVLLSGLFLMLIYHGTGRYYVEHLIFSLHFYAFGTTVGKADDIFVAHGANRGNKPDPESEPSKSAA